MEISPATLLEIKAVTNLTVIRTKEITNATLKLLFVTDHGN
jgi:hypothetical protein